ncbi:MAG: QueT transporter family protein [Lachnospiraceae bacterium]|nr:QueT transporter family protein [Lachnospiraceae bacterium]
MNDKKPVTIKHSVRFITYAAVIAAIYVVLTVFINAFNLASGAIQVRISEALTILPVFTPAAIPGLAIGCLISNTVTGCHILDIIFGTAATLIGAVGTRLLRKTRILVYLPPILSNAVIVPLVLKYAYGLSDAYWFLFVTVGAGEVISAGILGAILKTVLNKNKNVIFKEEEI